MTRLSLTAARDTLGETVSRVHLQGERVVLQRHGKDCAVLISPEDFELLRALEDRMDLEAARKALKEGGSIPLADVKARLGL